MLALVGLLAVILLLIVAIFIFSKRKGDKAKTEEGEAEAEEAEAEEETDVSTGPAAVRPIDLTQSIIHLLFQLLFSRLLIHLCHFFFFFCFLG